MADRCEYLAVTYGDWVHDHRQYQTRSMRPIPNLCHLTAHIEAGIFVGLF